MLGSMSDESDIWIHVYFSTDHFTGTSSSSCLTAELSAWRSLLEAQLMHLIRRELPLPSGMRLQWGDRRKLAFSSGRLVCFRSSWVLRAAFWGPSWSPSPVTHFSASQPHVLPRRQLLKGETPAQKAGSFSFCAILGLLAPVLWKPWWAWTPVSLLSHLRFPKALSSFPAFQAPISV